MKLKTLIISFFFIAISTTNFAQNTVLAKAFLKKAQKAYDEGHWKDAMTHIEKTKEYIDGTNPDIVYLEAKTRIWHDSNINKSKELFLQFLNEADAENDTRIEEVADIIADLETSNKYYSNGNNNLKTYKNQKGHYVSEFYNFEGQLIRKVLSAIDDIDQLRIEKYYNKGNLYLKNNYTESKKLYSQTFYQNNGKPLMQKTFEEGKSNDIEWIAEETKTVNNTKIVTKPKSPIVKNKPKFVWMYNSKGKSAQYWGYNENGIVDKFYTFKFFNSWEDYATHEKLEAKYYPMEIIQEFDNGMVKELRYWSDQYKGESQVYFFSEEGIPLEKKFFRRWKYKSTMWYNIKTE